MTIAFLPLDGRPVTRGAFLDLAAVGGADVITPPRDQLGHGKTPAGVDALWDWLAGPGAEAECVIASAELLIYGGLVPSRIGREPLDRCLALAARWAEARRARPHRRLYLCASNLRLPATADATEEPDYWAEFGPDLFALSFHEDRYAETGDPDSRDRAAGAAAAVPASIVADVRRRRARNLAVLLHLVDLTARGVFDALLIGQDDAAEYGWTRRDLRAVAAAIRERRAAEAWVTHGTDELASRLLARAMLAVPRPTAATGGGTAAGASSPPAAPRVRVTYSTPAYRDVVPRYEGQALDATVTSHIVTAGCRRVDASPDVHLFVHNSPGEQAEAPHQEPYDPSALDGFLGALAAASASGIPCGVADVRYSNGADRTLVDRLLAVTNAFDLRAYGGWNTASNTLGMTLAQTLLAGGITPQPASDAAVPFPRGGSAQAARLNRDFTILRLLDDWGYQAIVRQRLAAEILPRYPGATAGDIGPAYDACAASARAWLQETCVPPIACCFGVPVAVERVEFPWSRLFHVGLDLRVG